MTIQYNSRMMSPSFGKSVSMHFRDAGARADVLARKHRKGLNALSRKRKPSFFKDSKVRDEERKFVGGHGTDGKCTAI